MIVLSKAPVWSKIVFTVIYGFPIIRNSLIPDNTLLTKKDEREIKL